jgi:hypothetical protein
MGSVNFAADAGAATKGIKEVSASISAAEMSMVKGLLFLLFIMKNLLIPGIKVTG